MARHLHDWTDRRALDRHGEVLGVVVDDYVDPQTRQVRWLAVATGFFGTRVVVVPVRGASLLGGDVVIAHERGVIAGAPQVGIVVGIDSTDEQCLIDYYTRPNPVISAGIKETT